MFSAVEIFVLEQSVNVYIYLCVYYKVWFCCAWMRMFLCSCLELFDPRKRKKEEKNNLVKTFCKDGIVNTVLCYMLFFHSRNCTNCSVIKRSLTCALCCLFNWELNARSFPSSIQTFCNYCCLFWLWNLSRRATRVAHSALGPGELRRMPYKSK